MEDQKYIRKVQCAVTNFLYCGDKYLFLHRAPNKRVDPNKLSGVGGRLESGEDFLAAAIRETEEETGYKISPKDITLSGVVKLEGGYSEDWILCIFKMRVDSMEIPIGADTDDGKLVWIDKDKALDSDYEMVDDIKLYFKDIVEGDSTFFVTAKMDEDEKVSSVNISKIKK